MVDLAGRGLAILMISSELPEILGMSDRIAGDAARHRGADASSAPRRRRSPCSARHWKQTS